MQRGQAFQFRVAAVKNVWHISVHNLQKHISKIYFNKHIQRSENVTYYRQLRIKLG